MTDAANKPSRQRKVMIKKVYIHSCQKEDQIRRQEEVINRINLFLVGNGNPEDGALFKLAKNIDTVASFEDKFTDLTTKVDAHTKVVGELVAAQAALDRNKDKNYNKITLICVICGVIISLLALFSDFGGKHGKTQEKTETSKVEESPR